VVTVEMLQTGAAAAAAAALRNAVTVEMAAPLGMAAAAAAAAAEGAMVVMQEALGLEEVAEGGWGVHMSLPVLAVAVGAADRRAVEDLEVMLMIFRQPAQ
jgi:hypothetical protein